MNDLLVLLAGWPTWLMAMAMLALAALAGLLLHLLIFSVLLQPIRRMSGAVSAIAGYTRGPLLLILPLLAMLLVLPVIQLPLDGITLIRRVINLGQMAAVGWMMVRLVDLACVLSIRRAQSDGSDDLVQRQVTTRVQLLRRIAVAIICVVTVALMLMTFPSIQYLGVSLLASAGFAGIVVGMAARPALENLLAGLQIALTQPIRINDVVVVEDEYGWIEDIGATYVVVRLWDKRRLIVPLSEFISKPFQNWTRQTADILGAVYLYTDYSVPVDELREELHNILRETSLWDGKSWNLQVTNATERSMEIRALMSAPNSGGAWDLRCHVREKLIHYVHTNYPGSLPRVRAELHRDGASLDSRDAAADARSPLASAKNR